MPNILFLLVLCYDLQLVPPPFFFFNDTATTEIYTSTINNYKKMIQPRVGFSFNPYPGTVLRGGYGIFYGLNSNSTYYTQRRENGVYQQQFNVSATTNPNSPYVAAGATCTPTTGTNRCFQQSGVYPTVSPQGGIPYFTPPGPAPINQVTRAPITPVNPGTSTPAPGTISARGLDPNFKNPESMSWDLAVEQELPLPTPFPISYAGTRALRLPTFSVPKANPASAWTHPYSS